MFLNTTIYLHYCWKLCVLKYTMFTSEAIKKLYFYLNGPTLTFYLIFECPSKLFSLN